MSASQPPVGPEFSAFVELLRRLPGVEHDDISAQHDQDGLWRIGFHIDTKHPLAEAVEAKLWWILNMESREQGIPLLFIPLNPPTDVTLEDGTNVLFLPVQPASDDHHRYFNVSGRLAGFSPNDACVWLESQLPRPVEDHGQWSVDADDPNSLD